MKKNLFLTLTLIIIVSIVICGYYFFNNIFPKAKPINLPDEENIVSISIADNSGKEYLLSESDYKDLILGIESAKPTRKMSVNDYPTAENYFIISIFTEEINLHTFVYEENSLVYIEMPYEGIYIANNDFTEFIVP